ncbi:MAG: Peptide-methionine (R)-S-oxide reductase MsrB, partial [uncultured Gemmatimonadetes bacterium]
GREDPEDRCRVAGAADARAVPGGAAQGHGARLYRGGLGYEGRGRLPLHLLQRGAVPQRREVRFRLRMAQLHRPGLGRGGGRARGRLVLHSAHRGGVQPVRSTPWARLSRRPRAYRSALLHQLGVHLARAEAGRKLV